jgi:hypothetical protein
MTQLNDLQSLLLSHASQRDSGSLYPLPAHLSDGGKHAGKTIAALVRRGLVEERTTSGRDAIAREDGDIGFGRVGNGQNSIQGEQ